MVTTVILKSDNLQGLGRLETRGGHTLPPVASQPSRGPASRSGYCPRLGLNDAAARGQPGPALPLPPRGAGRTGPLRSNTRGTQAGLGDQPTR
jgi:hypothetical protein